MNPGNPMLKEARNLQRILSEDSYSMTAAIEARHYAVQAHRLAKVAYEAAEAGFLLNLVLNNDAYIAAKNAEVREVVRNRALAVARDGGDLTDSWRVLNECQIALDNAQMAYDQCQVRFKTARVAAELHASTLSVLFADGQFEH